MWQRCTVVSGGVVGVGDGTYQRQPGVVFMPACSPEVSVLAFCDALVASFYATDDGANAMGNLADMKLTFVGTLWSTRDITIDPFT